MGYAAIGLLFTGISTGLSVYSQAQQGQTAERAAEYNNDQAQAEATNQEQQFAEQAKRETINQHKQMATQRAALSTQGSQMTTGTPLAILGETASNFQTGISDAARANAMQTASIRSAGEMGLWNASQQSSAANLGALATGIKGVSSFASAYGHNRYTGAFK